VIVANWLRDAFKSNVQVADDLFFTILIVLYQVLIRKLSINMNYADLSKINHILSFFVPVGNLTYHQNKVFMPNQEIKYEWEKLFLWVSQIPE
jgi:hypothetical protein